MNLYISCGWLLAGAIFSVTSFSSPRIVGVTSWLFPVCLLIFSRSQNPLNGSFGTVSALFFGILATHRKVIPIPGIVYVALVGGISVATGLPFLADRLLSSSLPAPVGSLVFPMAWTIMEFSMSRLNPFGAWGQLSYTQFGILPLMQLAAVTGRLGVSFVITWFGSVAAQLVSDGLDSQTAIRATLAFIIALTTVLFWGGTRIAWAKPGRGTIRVAGIGSPSPPDLSAHAFRLLEKVGDEERERAQEVNQAVVEDMFELVRREADAGARIVVWHELSVVLEESEEEAFLLRAAELASSRSTSILLGYGVIREAPGKRLLNKSTCISAEGEVSFSYSKRWPVPGWEANLTIVGNGEMPSTKVGNAVLTSAICADLDHPEYVRQAGRLGADLLLVPASDWEGVKDRHSEQAVFTAIENGVALIRPVRAGVSIACDPYGRILTRMDHFHSSEKVFVTQMPLMATRTVYSQVGDLVVWFSAAGLIGAIIQALGISS